MSVAFHRGLTHELILRLQMAGVRLEEGDAQLALAGLLTREVDNRGNPVKSPENQRAIRSEAAKWVDAAVARVLNSENKHELMKKWEEDHPNRNPFPQIFPERVVVMIESGEEGEEVSTLTSVLEAAREELLYG